MTITYLVTTNKDLIPDGRVAMVDGTVPGWQPSFEDLHFDHHRPGGGMVQIDEMGPLGKDSMLFGDWCIVTTQVDADACVAAAWLQINGKVSDENQRRLRAIALDCDYLCIPPSESGMLQYSEFAAKAVAALKESGAQVVADLGLDSNRKTWTEEDKVRYTSECFRRGTEWLIEAALSNRPFPGQSGEADAYFERMAQQIEAIKELGCVSLHAGCIVFDQRSINGYIDPRAPLGIGAEIAKEQGFELRSVTLSVRSSFVELSPGVKIPGYAYTLGTVPWLAAGTDLTKVFPVLAEAEKDRRGAIGQPPATTTWGGRAAVGGSGWRDASLLSPDEVLALAKGALA